MPAQTYRPKGVDDAWTIKANFKPGLIDSELTVQINGESVIKEKLSDFQDSYDLAGTYDGHNVTASCSKIVKMQNTAWQVIVFVDNERAATF